MKRIEDGFCVCALVRLCVDRHIVQRINASTHQRTNGFTLVELMLGASILSIVFVALMGAAIGQSFLNTNARYLTAAMNDATRVMEQIRLQNTNGQGTCVQPTPIPSAKPPGSYNSWNEWLTDPAGGGGKSITQPDALELIAVTCQDQDGGTNRDDYCAPNQLGTLEWRVGRGDTPFDPLRITVAVGWRHGRRIMGSASSGQEFQEVANAGGSIVTSGKVTANTSGALTAGLNTDANGNGVIESQAMLTTLVTCR